MVRTYSHSTSLLPLLRFSNCPAGFGRRGFFFCADKVTNNAVHDIPRLIFPTFDADPWFKPESMVARDDKKTAAF
jgi:hypothetical protein